MDDTDAAIANECKEFIRGQNARNTVYSNTTASNFFKRFAETLGEFNKLEEIPPQKLNNIVALALKGSVKLDGKLYEPDCLSTYFRGLQRFLNDHDYPVNILVDPSFEMSRSVLAAKRKELVKFGGGNKPKATRALTDEEEDILWIMGYFGDKNPDSLLNAVWFNFNFGTPKRPEKRRRKRLIIESSSEEEDN